MPLIIKNLDELRMPKAGPTFDSDTSEVRIKLRGRFFLLDRGMFHV